MKAYIILLYCVFLFGGLVADTALCQSEQLSKASTGSPRHSLGAAIGFNIFHIKDEYLAPYVYDGLILSGKVSYQLRLARSRHTIEYNHSQGSIDSEVQPRDVSQYAYSISYAFTRSVHTREFAGGRLESFLGAGLSTFAAFTEMLRPPNSLSYFLVDQGWYWAHAVNVYLGAEYRLAEHSSVSLQLGSPVFRIVSRPRPGHDHDPQNHAVYWDNRFNAVKGGKSEFVWDNLVLLAEIEYTRHLNARFGFGVTYSFGYFSADRPLPMKMSINNFRGGILWLF